MRVILLNPEKRVYTANAYLILGDYNGRDDVNTLVDVGADGEAARAIREIRTGIGKKPVEQVILTHEHSDHTGGLAEIVRAYAPRVCAFGRRPGVTDPLRDGQKLRLGDRGFTVIHTPGHSEDSVCLHCADERVLFSGDTNIQIRVPGGTYPAAFVRALERLAALPIETIYSGHDDPITSGAEALIRTTLANVRQSQILP